MVEEFIFFYNVHAMQPRLALNYVAQTDFEFTIPLLQLPSPGIPSENEYPLHSQGFFVCLFICLRFGLFKLTRPAEDGLELILLSPALCRCG